MVKIATGAEREKLSSEFSQMFRARASVFGDRLGWAVDVRGGAEMDRYDAIDEVVYVMVAGEDGRLTGSLRILPTTGDTMMANEFAGFFDEPVEIASPTAWECTRFCVHPSDDPQAIRRVSSDLLIGLCELCLDSGIEHIVGLYDDRMTRIYRRIGWSPDPLAESRSERGHLLTGLWEVSPEALDRMRAMAGRRLVPIAAASTPALHRDHAA